MSMKTPLSIAGLMLVGLLTTGCAGLSQTQSVAEKKPAAVNPNTHKHQANKCTNSISHTHPGGANKHKHRYSCQSAKKDANLHQHPANKFTRSMKHSHPSGAKKHTHKYAGK